MVLNQLFVVKPTPEIIFKIINFLGLENLDDRNEFTILNMNENETVKKYFQNNIEINGYYLPCKRKDFKSLTNKNCITIARQFLKTIQYDIVSKEKYINNKKYLQYKLISKQEKEDNIREKKEKEKRDKEIIITFD